jgi:hypothetical protein
MSLANEEVGLEVNSEKTKYMLMSRSQKIGQKHSVKIANRSFRVHIPWNNTNRSKSHAWRDQEQTEFGECLLPFSSQPSVLLPIV